MKTALALVVVAVAVGVGLVFALRGSSGHAGKQEAAAEVRPLTPQACSAVYYGGSGRPERLLAVPASLQAGGYGSEAELPSVVHLVFQQRGFRGGRFRVGYQLCDVASAKTGITDPNRCRSDARRFAADRSVIGVVTLADSECSTSLIAPLNTAPAGPLAVVTGLNTYVGLTHRGPGTARDEPGRYYPTGKRNYARVIAADDVQGAADGELAANLGVRRAFVLDDDTSYAIGIASSFARAASRRGIAITGSARFSYPPTRSSPLVRRISASHPDAVFLGLGGSADSALLVRQLRAALGTRARLIAPDSYFLPVFPRTTGPAADGMIVSAPGVPSDQLPPAGRRFLAQLKGVRGAVSQAYAVYTAESIEVMLDAIGRSNGSRGSVTANLLQTRRHGLLGDVAFDPNGDVSSTAVSMYQVRGGAFRFLTVVRPVAGGR